MPTLAVFGGVGFIVLAMGVLVSRKKDGPPKMVGTYDGQFAYLRNTSGGTNIWRWWPKVGTLASDGRGVWILQSGSVAN